jgi:hypothetical protein
MEIIGHEIEKIHIILHRNRIEAFKIRKIGWPEVVSWVGVFILDVETQSENLQNNTDSILHAKRRAHLLNQGNQIGSILWASTTSSNARIFPV